jgi:dGTPase
MRRLSTHDEERIRTYILETESLLSPLAARNYQAVRRLNTTVDDIRTRFSRDADRIIHSRSYARYIDKTQVFSQVRNDHITHRVLHVQLVSKIARTIGRSLRLNEDLIEAIALGHDIGHTPFGHTGEVCLSKICQDEGIGPFIHNIQSIRFLDRIERCDLTLQVLDGILCHNGELREDQLRPDYELNWETFDEKMSLIQGNMDDLSPSTLEGCVVRYADTIAYIGRDVQDAREVGLLPADEPLPPDVERILGRTNREIVDTLIQDIIVHSDSEKDGVIAFGPDVSEALSQLKSFNYSRIYEAELMQKERQKIARMFDTLWGVCLTDIKDTKYVSRIYTDFIFASWVDRNYIAQASPAELVRDFIAGMTDRYFKERFAEIVMPKRVERLDTLERK